MLAAALGALVARASGAEAVSSGNAKPVETVRLTGLAGDPKVVPFGP